ncbi:MULTISPECIES: HdeD family acid-resistance protein [Rhodococcus]|uniref:HdeD family acid-resistance protein n=1 Tax=Rhodococcus TaxID=1827 RepID=UPI001E60FACB|nr:HdeD family acid-resistance protein [Rhodococcus pyridinivorans]MCD2119061.1 HdeD family acid-resistance protein [Rhodococcus pyridinivorans]MCZ4628086.1 HdeD family acid-resistance protein [Rhodococcus pyridinivorans]MCZ4649302.1 HdeD family acid-resistance protein [Rhodococcus pyridinivorans]MDJ0482325.1 HdeD family acid-resistance protein [Rhodococcus pyridinivorans]MDV7255421.1 HdeD family acid-resistance protein [Rhodococcus pyridinivorans]
MSTSSFSSNDPFRSLLKQIWWVVLLRGILAVLFGVVALVWPGITVWALVVVFAAYAIIDGIVLVVQSVRDKPEGWGWWLAMGIVSVLAGLVALFWPGITALALLYVIAFYAILFGITGIVGGIRFRKVPESGWVWSVLAGVVAVLFGIVLLIFPGEGILSLIVLLGIYAILFGVLLIILAFQARSAAKKAGVI